MVTIGRLSQVVTGPEDFPRELRIGRRGRCPTHVVRTPCVFVHRTTTAAGAALS